MKKFVRLSVVFCICIPVFNACTKEEPVSFDKTLLYGKWKSGTYFYVYNSNGSGYTWSGAADQEVFEEEAQKFTWTLTDDNLVQIHLMEAGVNIPKSYTVTELTATTLKYRDAYGKQDSFTKVN